MKQCIRSFCSNSRSYTSVSMFKKRQHNVFTPLNSINKNAPYKLNGLYKSKFTIPQRFQTNIPQQQPISNPYFASPSSQSPQLSSPLSTPPPISTFSSTEYLSHRPPPLPSHIQPILSTQTKKPWWKLIFGFSTKASELTVIQYFFRTIFRCSLFTGIIGGTAFTTFVFFPRQLAIFIGYLRGMDDVHYYLKEENMEEYYYPPKNDQLLPIPVMYRAYQTDLVKKISHIFYELNYIEANVEDINVRLSERYKELLKIRAHKIDDLDLWLLPLHLTPSQHENRDDLLIDDTFPAQIDLDVLHYLREQLPGSYFDATQFDLNSKSASNDQRKQRLAMRNIIQLRNDIDHIIDILDLTSIIAYETKRFIYQWVPEGVEEQEEWREMQRTKQQAQELLKERQGIKHWFYKLFPSSTSYLENQKILRENRNERPYDDVLGSPVITTPYGDRSLAEAKPTPKTLEEIQKEKKQRYLEFTGKSDAPSEVFDQIDEQVEREKSIIQEKRAMRANEKYKQLEQRLLQSK